MVQPHNFQPPRIMTMTNKMHFIKTIKGSILITGTYKLNIYLILKRGFDLLFSICILLIIWPVFLLIAVAIKIDSKGPVIYKHKRIGQYGTTLILYKFRSMVTDAESKITQFTPAQKKEWEANFKLECDPRITRIGHILRKTSLDELPQFLNILKGSLSVVGPRPLVKAELEKYGDNKDRLLSIKPGLTGFWQAFARSDCSYDQRMTMELYYVENASFRWDMRIIFATMMSVVRCKGAN